MIIYQDKVDLNFYKKFHEYCRTNTTAYWFGYFLPEARCKLWMLTCYCFRAFDNFTDSLAPDKAKYEISRFRKIIKMGLAGKQASFNTPLECGIYELGKASKTDPIFQSYLFKAYLSQAEDVMRKNFVNYRKLARIRRGKAIVPMKLWIYLTDPTLMPAAIEKIGHKLGLCEQYIDDIRDMEEDFKIKKSTVPLEQIKKYGVKGPDNVYDGNFVKKQFEKASKLHCETLNEIRKIKSFTTKFFILSFAVRVDPKDLRFKDGWRTTEKDSSNIVKKIGMLLKDAYPKNYRLGHIFAYVVGVPVLFALIAYKGYLKYLI